MDPEGRGLLVWKFLFKLWYLSVNLHYPPASEASMGVYWNQAQKNFTQPYTEYPWVSVTLWLCDSVTLSLCHSVANKPPIISAACGGIGPKFFLGLIGKKVWHKFFFRKMTPIEIGF